MIKIRWILFLFIILLIIPSSTIAKSPYGSMGVYYNDKILPGNETAKPILKIGEPFTVGINLTVYQKSDVYVSLSCMEKSSFVIINGPTSKIEDYSDGDVVDANSSKEYEWTIKPTDRWAGGSLPLDIYYTILAHGNPKPLVNSGFTVAYCTISNEHYKGEVPIPKEQKTSEKEPSPTSKPASMQDFSSVSTIAALSLVFLAFYRQDL
jgi:MAST domain-containing protein